MRPTLLVLLALLAPASAVWASSPQERQATYDAAQAAYDRSDWPVASSGFLEVLADVRARPLTRSEGVVAIRLAKALTQMRKPDAALAWIDKALPALRGRDPDGLLEALLIKGDADRARYAYAEAMEDYDAADALARSSNNAPALVNARLGYAYAGATINPSEVGTRLALLMKEPLLKDVKLGETRAAIEDLEARAALNRGDKAKALSFATAAVQDSGGLTTKVSLTQSLIRADAGLAARLNGDDEATRQYLTYTGAGHMPDVSWVPRHSGDPPVCGEGPDPLEPADSAVIALAVADDGTVLGATPVFASRPGGVGAEFARALGRWRWDPEKIAAVDPFWRATLEIEVRCVSRPRPIALSAADRASVVSWLKARPGLLGPDEEVKVREYLRADDPRFAEPGGAVLEVLARPVPSTAAELHALYTRLDAAKAPPAAYALALKGLVDGAGVGDLREKARERAVMEEVLIPELQQRFPREPALQFLLLDEAFNFETAGRFDRARVVLDALLAGEAGPLAKEDPIRSVALLHQAITLDRLGDHGTAEASLTDSGLNYEQCALFDTHPIASKLSADLFDFPKEAQRWRFEGFVQESFDIDETGKVTDGRAVIAYPPYIFEDAAQEGVRASRFLAPRIGDKTLGCAGQSVVIHFTLPT